MKKRFLVMSLVLSVLVTVSWSEVSTFATKNNSEGESAVIQGEQIRALEKLQPEVQEFIKGTYFEHASEFPDENEPVEVLKAYLEYTDSPENLEAFAELVEKYPDSRHANVGLAMKLYEKYEETQDKSDLREALKYEIKAAEIAASYGNILYTSWVKRMAIESGEFAAANTFFGNILEKYPDNYIANLHYAELLAAQEKDSAEKYFKKAIELRPEGNFDSVVAYVEFLIDENRLEEALSESILIGERALYLDFLHGYVLEKLGNDEEAIKYYKKFEEMSQVFPAPEKYKIPGSELQLGIKFEGSSDDVTVQAVNSATYNLSYVIACEAGTESAGGMKEVGYVVRQRVNRGTIPSCLYVTNSGSNMDEKYRNVICQAYQFAGVSCNSAGVTKCTNASQKTSTSDQVAYDVYNGRVAEAFTGYCPATGKTVTTNLCSGTCATSGSNTTGYVNKIPHSFLAYKHTPASCMKSAGNLCGNGGSDNWFDYSD